MAYDEALADRIRELVPAGTTEKKMFGGLGFMVGGNMAVSASGGGHLMVRCDPDDGAGWVDGEHIAPMQMRGRSMSGWLLVDQSVLGTDEALQLWVDRGSSYAGSLPVK